MDVFLRTHNISFTLAGNGLLSRIRTDNPGRIQVEIKPDLPGLNSVSTRPGLMRVRSMQQSKVAFIALARELLDKVPYFLE